MAKKRRKPQNRRGTAPRARRPGRRSDRRRPEDSAGRAFGAGRGGAHRAEGGRDRNVRPRPRAARRRTAPHAGREEGARARRTRGGPSPDRPRAAPAPARVDRRHRDRGRRRRVLLHRPERHVPTAPGALPGELTTEAPWPANAAKSAARATALGLPPEAPRCTSTPTCRSSSTARTSRSRRTSASPDAGAIQSLHTHSDPGVVHIESSESREFTLGRVLRRLGRALHPELPGGVLQRRDTTTSRCSWTARRSPTACRTCSSTIRP